MAEGHATKQMKYLRIAEHPQAEQIAAEIETLQNNIGGIVKKFPEVTRTDVIMELLRRTLPTD